MIDLPIKAKVQCSDGPAGRSTYVVFNPKDHQLTNLVVKSERPPFNEYLVPVDQVEETTNDQIKLKCTLKDLEKMEPFESEEYLRTKVPDYQERPYYIPTGGMVSSEGVSFIPVKILNISPDEMSVRPGARPVGVAVRPLLLARKWKRCQ